MLPQTEIYADGFPSACFSPEALPSPKRGEGGGGGDPKRGEGEVGGILREGRGREGRREGRIGRRNGEGGS